MRSSVWLAMGGGKFCAGEQRAESRSASAAEMFADGLAHLSDRRVTAGFIRSDLRENRQGIRLAVLEEDETRVVTGGGDFAGLVRHARAVGELCRNHGIELLVKHDLEHALAACGGGAF